MSRFEPVAAGTVLLGADYPPPPPLLPPLRGSRPLPDPYASGAQFHGPAFQRLRSLAMGSTGSSAILDASMGAAPPGRLHPILLDAGDARHPARNEMSAGLGCDPERGRAAYPYRIERACFHGPAPRAGRGPPCEARFAGFESGDESLPTIDLQFCVDGRVAAALRLISVLLPIGPFSTASPIERREFFAHRRAVKGLGLSRTVDGTTELVVGEVDEVDWLRGTVARAWGLPPGSRAGDHPEVIAVKDHVGRLAAVHPSMVEVSEDLRSARVASRPGQRYAVDVVRVPDKVTVRSVDAG